MNGEKELLKRVKAVKKLFEHMLAVSCEQLHLLKSGSAVDNTGDLVLKSVNRRQEIIEKIDSAMQALGKWEKELGISGLSAEAAKAGCLEGLYSEYIKEYVRVKEEINRIIISIQRKNEESRRLMQDILDDTAQKLVNLRINKKAVRAYLQCGAYYDPWFLDKKK